MEYSLTNKYFIFYIHLFISLFPQVTPEAQSNQLSLVVALSQHPRIAKSHTLALSHHFYMCHSQHKGSRQGTTSFTHSQNPSCLLHHYPSMECYSTPSSHYSCPPPGSSLVYKALPDTCLAYHSAMSLNSTVSIPEYSGSLPLALAIFTLLRLLSQNLLYCGTQVPAMTVPTRIHQQDSVFVLQSIAGYSNRPCLPEGLNCRVQSNNYPFVT